MQNKKWMQKGFTQRIGNGQSVSIYNDHWVSSELGPKFVSSFIIGNEALMASLILNDGN